MRVLQVSANYRPSIGGIERYVELLARGLAERGAEVTVLCCRDGDASRVEQGAVRVVRVPASHVLKRRFNLHYPLPDPVRFARELGRLSRSADVVHAHDALYLTSGAALVSARRRGVPSVLTQHVSFTPQASRALDTVERGAIATLGRCARLASRVVAYNAAVAEWAKATWRIAVIPVLPAGAPEPVAGTDRASVRRALGLEEDRFVAVFVGRDVPTKRLDLVLEAADGAYEIVAVTDRPAPGTTAGVRILPLMAHEQLQDLLLAADAFVLTSRAEGLPLSLQEAVLAGLPCVLTRVPGFDRYLAEDEAIWVDPTPQSIRDALMSLAGSPARAGELAARAKQAGRREFGFDAFVSAHEALYAGLVERARPR